MFRNEQIEIAKSLVVTPSILAFMAAQGERIEGRKNEAVISFLEELIETLRAEEKARVATEKVASERKRIESATTSRTLRLEQTEAVKKLNANILSIVQSIPDDLRTTEEKALLGNKRA